MARCWWATGAAGRSIASRTLDPYRRLRGPDPTYGAAARRLAPWLRELGQQPADLRRGQGGIDLLSAKAEPPERMDQIGGPITGERNHRCGKTVLRCEW